MKTAAGIALLGAVTLGTLNAAAPAPIACESLAQTKVTNGRVLSAESVQAGAFAPPNTTNPNAAAAFTTAPAFCRVTLPGMGHCQGGPGTDVFDKVAAVDRWVETGKKPQSIEAAHLTAGSVDRTRPLCAYPATANYKGTGSTDDANNFRCQ